MLKSCNESRGRCVLYLSEEKLTNAELISGIIEGDRMAARQFHLRYCATISRWVWHLLGGDREHEDMVQQVLVGVISGMPSIKKPESLDAWVRSVTMRVVRDELRNRKKRRSLFNADSGEDEVYADPNHPCKQVHIRSFYTILDKMNLDDRVIFVFKYLEGFSNEQVAEAVGFSLSKAKRRLKRARDRFLKEAMSDYALVTLLERDHGR